ncbi:MAG: MBL fold metallo-hydrolase [Desulfobacterales bacterium]|nr:MBL fold metallo-hydrolase [Desulfobacterales bacterium]
MGKSIKTESNNSLKICMLASGSKGNAIYISDGETSILIDAGLSGIELERRMKSQNINPEKINAIVVSHEHSDHVRGVGVLSRRFSLPVYINKDTLDASQVGKLHDTINFKCGKDFSINAFKIHPFCISHDAEDPAGFMIKHNHSKIGIATDLGIATRMVKHHLTDCDLLVLESNHDPDMLEFGPYPWPVKQRIRSRSGHLSNGESRDLLGELIHDNLQQVILAHLSETNNSPRKARNVVAEAIKDRKIKLSVATQDRSGKMITIK